MYDTCGPSPEKEPSGRYWVMSIFTFYGANEQNKTFYIQIYIFNRNNITSIFENIIK